MNAGLEIPRAPASAPRRAARFRISTELKIQATFATALICLSLIAAVSWKYIGRQRQEAAWVVHTHAVIAELESIFALSTDAQNGRRGYVLTGDEAYLEPSLAADEAIAGELTRLREMLVDNAGQRQRLDALEESVKRQQTYGEQAIEKRKAGATITPTGEGKRLHDEVRRQVDAMKRAEESLLQAREDRAQLSAQIIKRTIIGVCAFASVLSVAAIAFIARDLSRGRREQRAAIGRAEARIEYLASFPEQNPSPVIEIDLAAKTVEYANPVAIRLIPEIHEDGTQHPLIEHLIDTAEGGDGKSFAPHQCEMEVGGRMYLFSVTPAVEGNRLRIYGNDITERRQAEDRQRELLKEVLDLKTALDEHAIVAITDPQGKITYANDKFCAISKFTREELIGQDHRIVNSGYHPPEFIRELWTTIGRGKVWHGEMRNRAKDGSFYWVDTTIVPFLNERGKPRQYVVIRAEVTARKQAEDEVRQLNEALEQRVAERTVQLEAANKELEAFSYSVSHDLRAPLRTVDGFSQAVLEDYGEALPAEGRRYLETIRSGAQRMGNLIDDLLTFARLSRAPLTRHPIRTTRFVHEIWDDLAAQREGRAVELQLDELPDCSGDPALLRQVWVNLLSNALKYSRKRDLAQVHIGSEETEGETAFFVRDNGTGFDMRYAGKLFGVFQRLHRAEEFEGTGVGLAIVQRVVYRHGGRVWANGEVDRGATFCFTLGLR